MEYYSALKKQILTYLIKWTKLKEIMLNKTCHLQDQTLYEYVTYTYIEIYTIIKIIETANKRVLTREWERKE